VDGVACELIDTAGVDTAVENNIPSAIQMTAEGLAAERRKSAAIVAYCVESTAIAPSGDLARFDLPENCDVLILTKSDLDPSAFDKPLLRRNMPTVVTSSRSKTGLDQLRQTFGELLTRSGKHNIGSAVATTADRCRESVRLARQSVKSASQIVATGGGDEIVASELRESLLELGQVVGTVYTDDLLDRIFSQFCIGK
jgi:tRNA modification GTPase